MHPSLLADGQFSHLYQKLQTSIQSSLSKATDKDPQERRDKNTSTQSYRENTSNAHTTKLAANTNTDDTDDRRR